MTTTNVKTITMRKDKDCKGSVRYATDDAQAPVTNVYVSRSAWQVMPEAIVVTVAAK